MWIEMCVPSAGSSGVRRVRMSWTYASGEWQVTEDLESAWPEVASSDHGTLKRAAGGAVEMWDNPPGEPQHLLAAFWSPPDNELDPTHMSGFAQLCDPRTSEWHGYEVWWRAERREEQPLSELRLRAQAVLDAILPAPYLSPNYMANPFAPKNWKAARAGCAGYTSCVSFPAHYVRVLGCRQSLVPGGYPAPTTPGWRTPGQGGHPQAGDIYINCKSSVHDGSTAHVGVVRDTDYGNSHGLLWRTGDYGQTAGGCAKDPTYEGGFDGIFLVQKYDPFADTLQKIYPAAKPARAIHAWIDIEEFFNA